MAKDSKGKFTTEDFVPQSGMEAYMNVKHVSHVMGAAGANARTLVDTDLTLESLGDQAPDGAKWILYGATLQPDDQNAANAFVAHMSGYMMVSILRGDVAIGDQGTRAASNVIARCTVVNVSTAEKNVNQLLYAFDLLHPTPVVSSKLTITSKHTASGVIDSQPWSVDLYYAWAPISDADNRAIRQQSI